MMNYRKCPQCGSDRVCWNWVHPWGGDLDKFCEMNPHMTREELEQTMWIHECWNCGDDIGGHCFETKDKVLDGIPYEQLVDTEKRSAG